MITNYTIRALYSPIVPNMLTSKCRSYLNGTTHLLKQNWGCSSLGRAVGSQSAGTGIETLLLHLFSVSRSRRPALQNSGFLAKRSELRNLGWLWWCQIQSHQRALEIHLLSCPCQVSLGDHDSMLISRSHEIQIVCKSFFTVQS